MADFVVPRKADITKKRSQGEKRVERSFDSTAMHNAELLSTTLWHVDQSSTAWFSLRFTNRELDGNDEERWLKCRKVCIVLLLGLTFKNRYTNCTMT